MNFVFNELSTRYVAASLANAHSWLDNFFDICNQVENRSKKSISIVSTIKFSGINYHADTSFARWISTLQDADYRRRILSMITKEPIRVDYPYYYYQESPCQGLGYAFEKKCIGISYGSEYWGSHELTLTREQFNNAEQVETQTISIKHMVSGCLF